MKMKLTNAEAMNLFGVLTNLNVVGNGQFTYTIAKNRSLLKPHIDVLQEFAESYSKTHPELKEYQTKLDALLKRLAVDKDGKPVTRQSADGTVLSRVIPPDKQAEYMAEREKLDVEYRPTLLGMELHQSEFASVLKKEEEFDLRTIHMKDLPEGALNTQVMNLIFVFVEEEKGKLLPFRAGNGEGPVDAA